MNAYSVWIALVAAASFAVSFPLIYWYIGEYSPQLPPEASILASLVPMALTVLFATSWWGS